ncbi:transcriptional regulator, TetR family [Mucilaginibacter pineti]|uniref:Transcriptional regulator, TetR family n=1 Tax=Mucilaginibacter pineti TaxID=1391627 RepID=A0A1G7N8K8_9SPHI|nr:TetR/AcrR family transcriptional regulator [Mucilaginibacter pineti]SDF70383.1 transcriptional regulator, TetR family [Mucilaginibacter pineti]
MGTRRTACKERDSAQTQREFLDAVGRLFRKQGFKALTTGKIARETGKDKKLILYHFGSLDGLLEAYITDKDYWPPFFVRFRLGDEPGSSAVQELFTELMKENFKFFKANPEMQQIILWQISEHNDLLRKVSDAREVAGAKILAMADPFFEGSGINIRMVMAILLGGIYYSVLHSQQNKSTVSGIDVNRLADQRAMLKTIGQVLDWAWQAAAQKQMTK